MLNKYTIIGLIAGCIISGLGVISMIDFLVNPVDIMDFDNLTGILSNLITINHTNDGPYGIEFSSNNNILYFSDFFCLYQVNLLAGSTTNIINSVISLDCSTSPSALQMAPDQKIYIANENNVSIGVINNSNILGVGCNANLTSINLTPASSGIGLPTFFSSIFISNTVDVVSLCYGDSTQFTSSNTSLDSVLWNFGDVNSGNSNTSTNTNPYHIFSDTGNFNVTLYSYFNSVIDTSITTIYINQLPFINLLPDTSICDGDTLLLDVTLQGASYLWHDNSASPNYNLFSAGDYSVIVTDTNGCINRDTINVLTNPLPETNLGDDIEICEGDSVLIIDAYLESASYLWNDNSTTSSLTIESTGVYSVIQTDSNGCRNSDTIIIIINPLPNSDFTFDPQPTDLNNPNILFTNITSINTSYQWNLGDGTILENLPNINHTYQNSGEYDVSLISLNEFGCIDTIKYQIIIDPGGFDLFIPKAFTPNNDDHNELFVIKGRYIIDFNINIFNRWGKKIFESDNIEKYWDGRFEGKLVQQEKYTYLVTILDINGDIHEFTGIVNVIY